jgi:hypothetical protein
MRLFGGLFQTLEKKKKKQNEMSFLNNHMVGIKITGEQISILCHNGTIFDKPHVL